MLPSLKKGNERDFTATETKVYDPPRELAYFDHRKEQVSRDSNRNSSKVKYFFFHSGWGEVSNWAPVTRTLTGATPSGSWRVSATTNLTTRPSSRKVRSTPTHK